jgi:hypothetical protein
VNDSDDAYRIAVRIVTLRVLVAEVAEGCLELCDVAWLESDA